MQYRKFTRVLATAALVTAIQPALAQSASKVPVTEAHPCSDADFWIGEWEVREPDSIKIANVSVKAHVGHCVLSEDWTWTVPTDKSRGNALCLLAYSEERHNWQYDCGSDYGMRYNFGDGVLIDREFKFVDKGTPPGVLANFSYIALADGRVREHEEESADGGKTWKTTVEVFWNKRK